MSQTIVIESSIISLDTRNVFMTKKIHPLPQVDHLKLQNWCSFFLFKATSLLFINVRYKKFGIPSL